MTDYNHNHDPGFSSRNRLVLTFAMGLVLLSTAQLIYRLTLPTDGWAVIYTELDQPDWIYWSNLVGAPSGLEKEDLLVAVDGQSMHGTATIGIMPPPINWVIGQEVQMTILRDGLEHSYAVPVVSWTLQALWRYNVLTPSRLVDFSGAFILFAVGLFTFLKRHAIPSAQVMLVLCASIFSSIISGLLPDGLSVQFNPMAYIMTTFFTYMIFGTVLAPSLLAFTLLFPRPKRAILERPWLALMPYGLGLIILIVLVVGAPAEVGWLGTMGMFLASVVSLIQAGFTQRDAVSRAQLRWAVGGFVIGLGLALLTFPSAFGWVTNPVLGELLGSGFSLGIAVIGVTLAIAILRYRLFDIDLIIRKTLQYTLLTGLLALVYFGSVVVLQSLTENLFGEQSQLVIVFSTLVVAALFNPLRIRIQDFIDRRFFRKKYDVEQTLANFAAIARDEVDMDHLTTALLRVVGGTIQPERISLWLSSSRRNPHKPVGKGLSG